MRDDNKHRTAGSSQGKQPITAFAPGGRGFHTTCLPHQTWQAGLPRPTGRQACPRRSTRQAGRTKDTNIRRGGSQPPKQTAETAFSPLRVYTLPGVNPPEGGVNPLWGNLAFFALHPSSLKLYRSTSPDMLVIFAAFSMPRPPAHVYLFRSIDTSAAGCWAG